MLKVRRPPAVNWYLSKFSHNQTCYAARVALIVGGCMASAGARDTHTSFTVGATVRAMAHIEGAQTPSTIEISSRDIAQGYIDAPQITQLSIKSNSQHGYVLDFLRVAPVFTGLIVQGLEGEAMLGADGGAVVQRWQQPQPVHLKLKYRFMLAPGLRAGTYPWPLQLAVRPLEST
jgi:hypothetical protein